MVMHARKTQRMNDGYFEKHQTHPYQNSKYGSSKGYSSGERYERLRDSSPNGNYRSDNSPDSQSPRERGGDRSYPSKSSYLQKIREKERENRDYKAARDKYVDCVRSPKDKRNRDSEHRTNHDRTDDKGILHPVKREDRERITRVGDWSEHVSSSGKKYYYNCKTEVSQWEKPREWLDRERERFRRDRDRDYGGSRLSSSSSSTRHEKHSNSRSGNSGKDGASGSRHWSSSSSRDDSDVPSKDPRSSSRKHAAAVAASIEDGGGGGGQHQQQAAQDMDISPGDSTPTSEISYNHGAAVPGLLQANSGVAAAAPEHNSVGPVLLGNALPRLISMPVAPESSPLANPQSTPSMVPAPSSVTTANTPGPPRLLPQTPADDKGAAVAHHGPVVLPRQCDGIIALTQPLTVDTNHTGLTATVEGPPTPTHSETPDCAKIAVPVGSPSGGNLPTLQGMSSSLQALRPQGPTITPSLANHYRDDLVSHVKGWPADILEKQAQKLSEEAHIMGSIQCSKVSAELKTARSIVRLTEIQATLQEQRILFLRQQIKTLEELKSQNSFMSDDS